MIKTRKWIAEHSSLLLVAAVSAILITRLFYFISKYGVNLLASDDWNFLDPIFAHQPWWKLFFAQYSTLREGIGLVLTSYVIRWSHMNMNAVAMWLVVVEAMALVAALILKKPLFGAIALSDVCIAFIFLTLGQYEIFISSHNPASQAFPLLLVMLYCLAWLPSRQLFRYAAVLGINFLAIFSGYSYFLGLLTPLLLGVEAAHNARARQRRGFGSAIIAIAVSLASGAAFFRGFALGSGSTCFVFPYHPVRGYLWYVALMFANSIRLKGAGFVSLSAGTLLFAAAVAIWLQEFYRLCKPSIGVEERAQSRARTLVILLGFSLLICAATAIARICLRLDWAQASRYVPYLMPAYVGFYFRILAIEKKSLRRVLLAAIIAATGFAAIFLSPQDRITAHWLHDGKRRWLACYLQKENISACDVQAGFVLLPNADAFDMPKKMRHLKQNHLNLYSDRH